MSQVLDQAKQSGLAKSAGCIIAKVRPNGTCRAYASFNGAGHASLNLAYDLTRQIVVSAFHAWDPSDETHFLERPLF